MRPIPNFPEYQITQDGQVWSNPRMSAQKHFLKGGFRKLSLSKFRYLRIDLWRDGKPHICFVHRLVLETYVGPCPDGMECCHLNGNRQDNRLENLRWGTKSENSLDSIRHGTHAGLKRKGDKHPLHKLIGEDVRVIRYLRDVAKFSLRDIAWQFDIALQTVSKICTGKRWKHLYAKV